MPIWHTLRMPEKPHEVRLAKNTWTLSNSLRNNTIIPHMLLKNGKCSQQDSTLNRSNHTLPNLHLMPPSITPPILTNIHDAVPSSTSKVTNINDSLQHSIPKSGMCSKYWGPSMSFHFKVEKIKTLTKNEFTLFIKVLISYRQLNLMKAEVTS